MNPSWRPTEASDPLGDAARGTTCLSFQADAAALGAEELPEQEAVGASPPGHDRSIQPDYASMIVVVQSTVLSGAIARMLAENPSLGSGSIARA